MRRGSTREKEGINEKRRLRKGSKLRRMEVIMAREATS